MKRCLAGSPSPESVLPLLGILAGVLLLPSGASAQEAPAAALVLLEVLGALARPGRAPDHAERSTTSGRRQLRPDQRQTPDLAPQNNCAAGVKANQVKDILHTKLAKRGVDILALQEGKLEQSGQQARLPVTVREGIDKEEARRIVKLIKDTKLKLQAAIQGEKVRVTGKKRDDLQQVIGALREAKLELPLQFINFRD